MFRRFPKPIGVGTLAGKREGMIGIVGGRWCRVREDVSREYCKKQRQPQAQWGNKEPHAGMFRATTRSIKL